MIKEDLLKIKEQRIRLLQSRKGILIAYEPGEEDKVIEELERL